MSTGSLETILSPDLKSGLKITLIDEAGELYARVSWIHWDSGFRDSGLQIEDRIVGINNAPLRLPDEAKERRIARDFVIGGLSESKRFAQMGLQDGSPLKLTVLRRNLPGRGFTEHEVAGKLRAERMYYTADGKGALAPGGPERLGRNDAGDTWMTWFERTTFEWEKILDGRWYGRFDNRRLLAEHLELKPRIDAALKAHPGEFTKRLALDWERVAESLRGRKINLQKDALAFREQSDRIEQDIAAAGEAAWTAFLKSHDALDSLPTLDLIRDDRAPIAGKVIALPGITWRDAVKDGDRNIFTTSHSNYFCYIAADQPAMRALWQAQANYQARVEPRVQEKYDLIGRVLPDPRLVVTPRNGAKVGLNIEVLGVRVPGHFFIDVTKPDGSFAGAELATLRGGTAPPDDASPSDVMRAYVQATKAGDEQLWQTLYADWVAMGGGSDRPLYRAFDSYRNYMNDYTRARNLLLHKLVEVEPVWESDPRVVIRGDEFEGAPKVESVEVIMDHFGEADGEYRVVNGTEVTRVWLLQRRDGGPWRISSRNTL
jgi:hypothetical protein